MRRALLVLGLLGCRRPAAPPPPPEPDAALEFLTPAEVKQKVTDTLEKEHERTLGPIVE